MTEQPRSGPGSNPEATVVIYDHDGYQATVREVDLPHWLAKGFVADWPVKV